MAEYTTKDSGARETYASGMVRDVQTGKPRFDLLLPENVPYDQQFLTRCAELLARGAEKYDARNWEKADSHEELDRAKASAFRHFMQWMNGEQDEDHAAAVFYGLLFVETLRYKLSQKPAEELWNVWRLGDDGWDIPMAAVSYHQANRYATRLFGAKVLPVGTEPDTV